MPPVSGLNFSPLRLAVVGCGMMGRRHLQAARNAPGVTLSATYDSRVDCGAKAGKDFDVRVATSLEGVCKTSDAVVIAVPTHAHNSIATTCLNAGLHCLVEKPLALSETECRQMVDVAAVKNLVLQVGHVERFNPAVEALQNQNLVSKNIRSITARRMNPASGRIIEDDVVLDLMVHDLDLIIALKNLPITAISARNLGPEHSNVALTFADTTTATVTASRAATERARNITIVMQDGTLYVDYARRTARVECGGRGNGADKKKVQALEVKDDDPLEQQLTHFADCIRGGHKPRVSGEQALATMKLAWRIQAALKGSA
jgi:predicted dehydrogenase